MGGKSPNDEIKSGKTMSNQLDVEAYLTQFASLDRYWMYANEGGGGEVIHYVDEGGKVWVLLDDNNERFQACIRKLRETGCLVFTDIDEAVSHEEAVMSNRRPGAG